MHRYILLGHSRIICALMFCVHVLYQSYYICSDFSLHPLRNIFLSVTSTPCNEILLDRTFLAKLKAKCVCVFLFQKQLPVECQLGNGTGKHEWIRLLSWDPEAGSRVEAFFLNTNKSMSSLLTLVAMCSGTKIFSLNKSPIMKVSWAKGKKCFKHQRKVEKSSFVC